MSMHKSLRLKNTLLRQRSVLTRWERIEKLRDLDKWAESDGVLGLPKVRTKFKIRSRKAVKQAEGEGTEAPKAGSPKAGSPKAGAAKAGS